MRDRKKLLRVGITTGDPNGIGCELILKTFQDKQMLGLCTPIVFGSDKLISSYAKQLGVKLNVHRIKDLISVSPRKLNLIEVCETDVQLDFGKQDVIAGKYAVESLEKAVESLEKGQIDVLVTSPINKWACQSESFKFVGHTEYLEDKLEGENLMFMISENLKVALLTNHIPIKDISREITQELIESKIQILNRTLIQDFGITKPKIAILGINPHTGDRGLIGKEDLEILAPTIRKLFNNGKLIFGPYASDGFFGSSTYHKFDAIMATYHDQGLIPFKTIAFGQGVNFTAGLSRIRTSPDHGTGYDIAGRGIADESSFRQAIYSAIDIYHSREDSLELKENAMTTSFSKER